MDYDNSGQDTSNYGDTYDSNSYSQDARRQDDYESQHHGTHDSYSYTKEHDSPKIPESKSVEFLLPLSTDDTSDLIDMQKDNCESHESTPQLENGNYENSIIDHFDAAFVNLQKDTNGTNGIQNVTRDDDGMANQNKTHETEDTTDCCSCNSGPLMCLAIFCDCFGL